MKIKEKIKILDTILSEKRKTDPKSINENQRILTSQQIFVLEDMKTQLLHSIGEKTEKEKAKEDFYYGSREF